jgi:hypothetical protein
MRILALSRALFNRSRSWISSKSRRRRSIKVSAEPIISRLIEQLFANAPIEIRPADGKGAGSVRHVPWLHCSNQALGVPVRRFEKSHAG